jgi:hypothetical protein
MFALGMTALLVASGTAVAQNNPAYESWAKHKPGTMIRTRMVSEAAGNKTQIETTQTLKEVTPEKVVLETKSSMEMMGQKMDQPAQPLEIPAKAGAAAPGMTPTAEQPKQPDMEVKESEETVTVAGKSVKAKVVEMKGKQAGMDMWTKTWTSNDVPGTLVKMESKTGGEMASSSTLELVEMELK